MQLFVKDTHSLHGLRNVLDQTRKLGNLEICADKARTDEQDHAEVSNNIIAGLLGQNQVMPGLIRCW